jgi:hypothetical protein
MLQVCGAPDCETLTFGPLCIAHEAPAEPCSFPRGRPYRLREREVPAAERRIEETWPVAEQVLLQSQQQSPSPA